MQRAIAGAVTCCFARCYHNKPPPCLPSPYLLLISWPSSHTSTPDLVGPSSLTYPTAVTAVTTVTASFPLPDLAPGATLCG